MNEASDRKMLNVFLETLATDSNKSLTSIDLYQEPPPWYDEALYNYLWKDNENSSESVQYMLKQCKYFNNADLITIAAPVWNSSIPAILKAWIDIIISPNQTYRFGNNGIEPIHKIKRMLWLVSSGGPKEKVNRDNHFLAIQRSPFKYVGINEIDVIWADKQEPALFAEHEKHLSNSYDEIREYVNNYIL